jgi:hypothetical protein
MPGELLSAPALSFRSVTKRIRSHHEAVEGEEQPDDTLMKIEMIFEDMWLDRAIRRQRRHEFATKGK